MEYNYLEYYKVFQAFCDENRILILRMLRDSSCEKSIPDFLEELKISQSTLRYHIGILLKSGLASSLKKGNRTYIYLSKTGAEHAKTLIDDIT